MLVASSRVRGFDSRNFPFNALLQSPDEASISWAYAFHQDKASSVKVPVANVTLSSSAHLLRENTDSVRSNQRMRNFSWSGVSIGIVSTMPWQQFVASRAVVKSAISCRMASKVMAVVLRKCFPSFGRPSSTKKRVVRMTSQVLKDGDNDTNDGDDDERER
ncbi:hypothetical protein Tco_1132432 [Tanacetum coccineum]|uniref:Uncharacterized protein n=1 Tax=Tanacetum coccineum TaxID=301880 RepID=A0ABQ5JCI7_9ASTR